MKYPTYEKEIAALLARDGVLSVKDFTEVQVAMPMIPVSLEKQMFLLFAKAILFCDICVAGFTQR